MLAVPETKKGNMLSNEIKLRDLEIFESNEFSRMFPGKKDRVSLKINAEKGKRQKRYVQSVLQADFYSLDHFWVQ